MGNWVIGLAVYSSKGKNPIRRGGRKSKRGHTRLPNRQEDCTVQRFTKEKGKLLK